MPGLIVWKEKQMDKFKRDMDRLFETLLGECRRPHFPMTVSVSPQIDVAETEDTLVINGIIPDMDPEDLNVSIDEDILTIKGEIRTESTSDDDHIQRLRREHRSFSQSFRLPCKIAIDKTEATFKNGILNIVLPKSKQDTTKEIKIKVKE